MLPAPTHTSCTIPGRLAITGFDIPVNCGENMGVKAESHEVSVKWWPYALEVQPSKNGLLLVSRRKTRTGWAKAFRRSRAPSDDLASLRTPPNEFELKDWQW